jgi:hypothetical protein
MANNYTGDKKYNWLKGSAKLFEFEGGGEKIHLDLNLAELNNLPVSNTGFIKITLSRKKEVDKYGSAYSIYENDYKPKDKEGASVTAGYKPAPKAGYKAPGGFNAPKSKDDMPF